MQFFLDSNFELFSRSASGVEYCSGKSGMTTWGLNRLQSPSDCLRPYHVENTSSRPITEVKQRRAWLVLRWVTAWEHHVLYTFFSLAFSVITAILNFLLFSRFLCVYYRGYFPLTAAPSLWSRLTGQSVKMLKSVMSPKSFLLFARDPRCHANIENSDQNPV